MSRLDYCQYELVDDCYDWKNDNCDECNIFKAYCEGARMAKASIVRCKDCRYRELDGDVTHYYWCRINERPVDDTDYCAWGMESEVEE